MRWNVKHVAKRYLCAAEIVSNIAWGEWSQCCSAGPICCLKRGYRRASPPIPDDLNPTAPRTGVRPRVCIGLYALDRDGQGSPESCGTPPPLLAR